MKTTKQDFELFRSECERWIEFFGLKDYKISWTHEKLDEETDAQTTGCDEEDFKTHGCVISLSTNITLIPQDQKDFYIKQSAFHEVCEVMMMDIYIALGRFYSDNYCQKLGHQIIHRLENSVFKKFQNEKVKQIHSRLVVEAHKKICGNIFKKSTHYGCAHCESTIGKMKITKTSRKFICGKCDYITVFKN